MLLLLVLLPLEVCRVAPQATHCLLPALLPLLLLLHRHGALPEALLDMGSSGAANVKADFSAPLLTTNLLVQVP